jgi:hypothetical protein
VTFARLILGAALAAAPGLAAADEPSGCDAFKWPLDHERAALVRPDKPAVANGGAFAYDVAVALKLAPLAEGGLPMAPERAPKSPQSFAGHFTLPAPAHPGVHKITISATGWLDVIDGGKYLRPVGVSGATSCEGARRSVKFDLPPRPITIQFSGVKNDQISAIVSPDE